MNTNIPGCVAWLTGLSGSGKTTTAYLLQDLLKKETSRVQILDGDEVRKELSPELGFSREDRELHGRRVAYISRLLEKHQIVTIVCLISPYQSIRDYARSVTKNFIEVWIKCSVDVCSKRDPKGIYRQAAAGSVSNLTGVQDPYEDPLNPEIVINTEHENKEQCAERIYHFLMDRFTLIEQGSGSVSSRPARGTSGSHHDMN